MFAYIKKGYRSGILAIVIAIFMLPMLQGNVLACTREAACPGAFVTERANMVAIVDTDTAADGYISICNTSPTKSKIKVIVLTPQGTYCQYTVFYTDSCTAKQIPLTGGDGTYTVRIYENTTGIAYRLFYLKEIAVHLSSEFAPFLCPNIYAEYTKDSQSTVLAAELCKDATTNWEKTEQIYQWITSTMIYDTEKAKAPPALDTPDIDQVLSAKRGICLDVASLTTVMLRSQGVPTKLVFGYVGETYHSWVLVFSDKEERWVLLDPTFGAASDQGKDIMQFDQASAQYKMSFTY